MANRILIVSADEADVAYLRRARDTYLPATEVEWNWTLAQALANLAKGAPDLLIADCTLPDSHGLQTVERLRNAAAYTPMLTLHRDEHDPLAHAAMECGSSGFLVKHRYEHYLLGQTVHHLLRYSRAEVEAHAQRKRAETTLDSIGDAVITTTADGIIDYMNAAATVITGWPRDEAIGRPAWEVLQLLSKEGLQPIRNPLDTVLEQGIGLRLPAGTILVRPDGSEVVIEDSTAPIVQADGAPGGAVIVFHDVSMAHDMMEQVSYLASHDFLTDLPNRRMLLDRIHFAIAAGARDRIGFALLYLDLDNFKHVNDSLGHTVGDKLLCEIARRLRTHVRATDTVSRQGGDEFVVLILDTFSRLDAAIAADKILDVLLQPFTVDQHQLHITTSIGISQFPDDGADAIALIKHADTAMYEAKDKGGNNRQFFVSEMNARAVERQRIESSLRHALERDELTLYYQPKVDLRSGRVIGAEALLRWRHPEWGLVAPDRFIGVAEDFGLIVPMGRWVLREACMQACGWQRAGLPLSTMAVNVSAVEFRRQEFAEGVQRIIAETGVAPEMLELEITESVLMSDAEASRATLSMLKQMGVRVAVDDFGTGYSSLSYLRRFPIDVLKIDRSFVSGIGSSEDDGSIAGAVISMGSSLKYRVVAEGVEERVQLDFLRERHCDEAQGFYFSAPVDAGSFERLLAARHDDWRVPAL